MSEEPVTGDRIAWVWSAVEPLDDELTSDEAAAARGLSELAESVHLGAVPYERLLLAGRRRLWRRRLLTGVGALVFVAVAGAGAVLSEWRPGGSAVTPAAVVTPIATATPTPTATRPGRDPFTPVRVKIHESVSKGHALEAWVALWPAAPTSEDGAKQAELIWAERHAADPTLTPGSSRSAYPSWDPSMDRVDIYLVSDGKRQPMDRVQSAAAPGGPKKVGLGGVSDGVPLDRVVGTASVTEMAVIQADAAVAKVVVGWKGGGSTEVVPVGVGDSPSRWYAVVHKPNSSDSTVTSYAADGSVLGTETSWW
ncbi:hypothetical protein ACIRVF_40495 [Kitasatospora sp. NPDC101157]|uniref:hypothetical protein n=1 Tax=Kitasatospora sp. NPDC101157 TaxID=3364098 RepID=UPI003802EEEB